VGAIANKSLEGETSETWRPFREAPYPGGGARMIARAAPLDAANTARIEELGLCSSELGKPSMQVPNERQG